MADLPSPPFVAVDGIYNFRDIGGYPTASSAEVRRGLLYRSASPYLVTQTGKGTLAGLKLRTVFDLRSNPEVEDGKLGHVDNIQSVPGLEYRHTPVFPNQDASPEALALHYKDYIEGGPAGFTKAYKEILERGAPAYREILLHIRDRPKDAMLFHCSAGKDRTGVLSALILKLAGVDDETISREYELTERGMGHLRKVVVDHLAGTPVLGGDRDAAMRMSASQYESMIATLEMIEKDYGGVEQYLMEKCRLTKEDLDVIRKNLTAA